MIRPAIAGADLRAVMPASRFAAVIHWLKPKEPEVSERALAFVEEWIADHVTAKDAKGDVEARAKALADQCLADASKGGIPASEIGEAIDDLPDFMVGAVEEVQERDEHADRFETDKEAAELIDPQALEDAEEDALEDEDDDEKQ
jgi:hypothetical protein